MTLDILSLPVDVPWHRLAVSEDMYVASSGENLPAKWHTSLTVFSYEPPPDPSDPSPDEITTFLKISASVTGYQPDDEIDPNLPGAYGTTIISNYTDLVNSYYPALSALVQLAVFPGDGKDWDFSEYPYLSDAEPKKREVVELVTDTGEALTQSDTNVNVRKGTTSTDSTEMVNIDRGGSFGMNASGPQGGHSGLNISHQQESGTTASLGTEAINVVTTDASREKREAFSHTANLSQLYQTLDAYHVGTNRCVFFLNARPHIVDSPYTFVNGPRRLEGIQEFFLVVRRPAVMSAICVDATLETAHLHESDTQVTTGTTTFDREQLTQTFTNHADGGSFSADDRVGAWTMQIPGGYELDRSRGGGTANFGNGWGPVTVPAGVSYTISGNTEAGHQLQAMPTITTYDDHVDITNHVYGIQNLTSPQDANVSLTVTVHTISVDPTSTPQTTTEKKIDLFITARGVSSCHRNLPWMKPSVIYERDIGGRLGNHLDAARGSGIDAAIAANRASRLIQQELVMSFAPGARYPLGDVSFLQSDFALRNLAAGIPAGDRQLARPLHSASPPSLAPEIRKLAPNVTVGEALESAPAQIAATTGLNMMAARQVLAHALGARAAGTKPSGGARPRAGKSSSPTAASGSRRTSRRK